jgi:hypothetical protein
MKTISVLALTAMVMIPSAITAQNSVEASVSADIVSHYVWRGQDRGGVSIQPEARVAWKGLSLTLEGSAGFDSDDDKELDLTLGYELKGFNIGVTDYWQTGIDAANRYFYYDKKQSAHQFEGNLGYTCKYFSLQGYCIFYGNDFKADGKQAYSTYAELTVPFRLAGLDWQLRAGMTPFESSSSVTYKSSSSIFDTELKPVKEYYYAEGVACTDASIRATKDLSWGKLKLPVFAELSTNPYLQTAHMIFGISIIPF